MVPEPDYKGQLKKLNSRLEPSGERAGKGKARGPAPLQRERSAER